MQHSVLTRQSGHIVQPRQVCLTVSCVYTHPVQGLASLRTLDYNSSPCMRALAPGYDNHVHSFSDAARHSFCGSLPRLAYIAASAKVHWLAAQNVMRFLQKTVNLGLQFSTAEGNSVVEAYSNADFANALSPKSVSGNMLTMYGNCVFWRSKRQDIIAGDTNEADLIGMRAASNELMWLKKFCTDLAIDAKKPTLWGDNRSANLIAVSSDRYKHIRVRHLVG